MTWTIFGLPSEVCCRAVIKREVRWSFRWKVISYFVNEDYPVNKSCSGSSMWLLWFYWLHPSRDAGHRKAKQSGLRRDSQSTNCYRQPSRTAIHAPTAKRIWIPARLVRTLKGPFECSFSSSWKSFLKGIQKAVCTKQSAMPSKTYLSSCFASLKTLQLALKGFTWKHPSWKCSSFGIFLDASHFHTLEDLLHRKFLYKRPLT